jgi:uncharacterized protein YaiL (DUF2058 family)
MADDDIKRLEKWQDEYKQKKEYIAREEQLKFEIKLHETKLGYNFKRNRIRKFRINKPLERGKKFP